ncbi:MAG TPA: DUF1326 domain-containing protein [Blastocatellia bacterium]|nr:DUF1326 domain-containing protein [Blastocatellia bacterium]
MRKFWFTVSASTVLLALAVASQAQQISGDYVETRSADIYTGYCFANAERGLAGNEAILGWRIREGDWNGINLAGLSVVGVVRANATLGDEYGNPYPAKSVLVVDERADQAQRAALVEFARSMGGQLFANVARVEPAAISLDVIGNGGHATNATLVAGSFAVVKTRAIMAKDHICGNEEVYYQPLVETTHAMPAVADIDRYSGPELGVSWNVSGKRSAFVATFNYSDALRSQASK